MSDIQIKQTIIRVKDCKSTIRCMQSCTCTVSCTCTIIQPDPFTADVDVNVERAWRACWVSVSLVACRIISCCCYNVLSSFRIPHTTIDSHHSQHITINSPIKMDIDPNAVSVVACAAGHLCQAPQGADLSKSTHKCLNCDNCLHSHVFCGKPWSMLENIVPRKHLSVNGAAKASSTSNPEAITVCYTCLSNIALLCDQEADDTICAMLPGATLSEDVPSVLPPPPALPPLAITAHTPTGAVSFDSSHHSHRPSAVSLPRRRSPLSNS